MSTLQPAKTKTPLIWMDAHCHLSEEAFDDARADIYAELLAHRIHGLVLAGTEPKDWARQKLLHPPEELRLVRAFGMHPWWIDQYSDEQMEEALTSLRESLADCQAIGELGLDYYRAKTPDARARQKKWFEAQLAIASHTDHPLILHVVRAHHEALPVLRKQKRKIAAGKKAHGKAKFQGLVHAFWANREVAEAYIDLGFLLSIPPRIMKEDPYKILTTIDPEHLVFETDTPFIDAQQQCVRPIFIQKLLTFAAAQRGETVELTVQRQERQLTQMFPILRSSHDFPTL